jgi:TonB family protein
MAARYDNLPGAEIAPNTDVPNVHDILRHRGPLDATLPPTPMRDLLAASGATLFVLATDATLVTTVRRAADQHPLFVVETWVELLEAVAAGRCGIALLDAALLGSRVPHCLAALAAYDDRLVTLVAADRTAAPDYFGFLSDGRIHRLLIKPLAIGATRLLIESATARRLQLREEAVNDDVPGGGVVVAPPRFQKWRPFAAAAGASALTLFAVAIAGFWLGSWDRFAPEPTAAPAPAAVTDSTPTLDTRLADYRAKAGLARQEGRLASPVGDSALDHYLAILALAPGDLDARAGVSSVVETLFTRAEEALLAESLEAAAMALDQIRRVEPASSRLAFLEAQLARALATFAAPPLASAAAPPPVSASAAPTASAAPAASAAPTELESVLSLATSRLRRGQLLAPAGDSAMAYVERAAQLAPSDGRVGVLRTDLTAALVAAGRLVFDTDIAVAANFATQARRLGVDSAALAALEGDVRSALTQRALLSERLGTASERVQNGALFAPEGDSAFQHLSRLQADAPALEGLAETWEAFRQAGVQAIENTLGQRNWAAAEAQLAALSQAPGGAAVAAPLSAELAAGRLQEAYLATVAPASELTLRSATPAVYPQDALARQLEGWVDLEFILDREGQPRDLVVTRASPPGRFDAAALAAVAQYRYVPFEFDGRVYERRIRLRVRFQLQ